MPCPCYSACVHNREEHGVLPVQAVEQLQLLERSQLLHVRPAGVHLGRGCAVRQHAQSHLMVHLE